MLMSLLLFLSFFFFNDTATTEIYSLSLHDALPILWLKLVKDFLKVRCRLALLPFLISCLIWLDLVASLPLIKERILVIILLLHFLYQRQTCHQVQPNQDRKSGSAGMPRPISYAVFCLKKKILPYTPPSS